MRLAEISVPMGLPLELGATLIRESESEPAGGAVTEAMMDSGPATMAVKFVAAGTMKVASLTIVVEP